MVEKLDVEDVRFKGIYKAQFGGNSTELPYDVFILITFYTDNSFICEQRYVVGKERRIERVNGNYVIKGAGGECTFAIKKVTPNSTRHDTFSDPRYPTTSGSPSSLSPFSQSNGMKKVSISFTISNCIMTFQSDDAVEWSVFSYMLDDRFDFNRGVGHSLWGGNSSSRGG